MKYEYLIFNLIVLSGPLIFGSLKRFYFLNYFKDAIISITIAAIPLLLWDIAVVDRHWFFAEKYTLGYKFLGLPIEEIMFFFTVPYACLFTWQMLKKYNSQEEMSQLFHDDKVSNIVVTLFGIIGILASYYGKEYTAIASLGFVSSLLFDRLYGANIFITKLFWKYLGLVSFFTLIFNGYLTWLPIVTYDELFQVNFRVFTIPIEDFFFGFTLLIIATTIFEKRINRNVIARS